MAVQLELVSCQSPVAVQEKVADPVTFGTLSVTVEAPPADLASIGAEETQVSPFVPYQLLTEEGQMLRQVRG